MQLNLEGKTALITGSSKGIGFCIAQVLQAEGCKVAINSRNSEQLNKATAKIPGSIGLVGDVTQVIDAQRIVYEVIKAFGKLDILVCNAGGGKSVPPGEETPEEWQRVFSLNLWSTINTVSAARHTLEDSKGVIICISSICGLETIADAPITYSAAKAALHSYVRGISRPLGKNGVRINAIAPGNILFDGSVWSRKLSENSLAVQSMLERDVSLGCLGQPQDIANLVAYLSSAHASFASGAIWTLDGGQVNS
jgi:3-oxoacyl-[acyl-carrier protein] reductase